jgi:carbonic anhydrase/acetyltransferase-like protein (isoleucine patch superfamily)
MMLRHLGKSPKIHPTAYVAPNATVCGNVTIGPGCRIAFGAAIIAEGTVIELGENCIVMENAVIRSTDKHATTIGSHCLIGPHSHLVGCTLEDCVFVATGASVFHGSRLRFGSEVRINAVVHIRTDLPAHATVPIGWVAVGDPAKILPPDQHDTIWAIQMPLNFPKYVYGIERPAEGGTNMPEITRRSSEMLASHKDDTITV